MKLYIGTKVVRARPMTRAEYNSYRGWPLPADENGDDAGMLVEYVDGGPGNMPAHKGYVSWSPLAVFERAYRPTDRMTFSDALTMLKRGHRVARAGWNGKSMFLTLEKGCFDGPLLGFADGEQPREDHQSTIDGVPLGLFTALTAGCPTRLPHINMRTASGSICVGWLASQTDMLAEDWEIVP